MWWDEYLYVFHAQLCLLVLRTHSMDRKEVVRRPLLARQVTLAGYLLVSLVRATMLRYLSAQISRKDYLLATFTPLGQRYGISHALVHSVLLIIFLFILFFRFWVGFMLTTVGTDARMLDDANDDVTFLAQR